MNRLLDIGISLGLGLMLGAYGPVTAQLKTVEKDIKELYLITDSQNNRLSANQEMLGLLGGNMTFIVMRNKQIEQKLEMIKVNKTVHIKIEED